MLHCLGTLFLAIHLLRGVSSASADDWRTRSIYQLITDRIAPAADNALCDTADRAFCGGTWRTIVSKLDYIQGMGFSAVWISPVGLNLEGNTAYGYAYHGYWSADPTKLNPHFGTSDDLKALSAALHSRGMYLMMDLVLNNLVSESTALTGSQLLADDNDTLLFKSQADFHPPCNIQWGNRTSEQLCWLATQNVALMDLATETDAVANVFLDWVPGFVQEYSIDGFRIDATKHMGKDFQHKFCLAAGVFCIGEVAGDNATYAATYQGEGGIDSVWGFGLMYGFVAAFSGPRPTMGTLLYYMNQGASSYTDPSVIGQFLDNQDLPRFHSLTSDASLVYNAIVGCWMYGGIPTAYYGLEQDVSDGSADPANREALWLYNNFSTTVTPTYARIASLNKIRSFLNQYDPHFAKTVAAVAGGQSQDLAWSRPGVLIVLTNRGSSGSGTWQLLDSTFPSETPVLDLLSCSSTTVGNNGSLTLSWSSGQPFVYVNESTAAAGGFCGLASSVNTTNSLSPTSISTDHSISTSTSTSHSIPSSLSSSQRNLSVDTSASTAPPIGESGSAGAADMSSSASSGVRRMKVPISFSFCL